MHRAALAQKSRAELFEDAIALDQDAPKPLDVFGLVGSVVLVFIEWSGIVKLHRLTINLYFDSQGLQRRHVFRVKIGDETLVEAHGMWLAVTGSHPQLMSHQIEFDLQRAGGARDGGGG